MTLDQHQKKASSLYNHLRDERKRYDGIVFDIDGVLLLKGVLAKNANALLLLLRETKTPYALLTNDGSHSIVEKINILESAGLKIDEDKMVSCGDGLLPFAMTHHLSNQPVFIMGDLGDPCYAKKAGFLPTRELDRLDECAGVIVGEENYEWEDVINGVINFFINHPSAFLAVPNPDEYYPGKKLKIRVASGGVARFIQSVLKTYGIQISPIYLGKPHGPIFEMTHIKLESQAGASLLKKRILMVGDNLTADIKGAQNFGYQSCLLLTGITHQKMLNQSLIKPDRVFDHL